MKITTISSANLVDIANAARIFTALGIKDPETVAEHLVSEFGSFAGIVEATEDELKKRTSPATARKISALLYSVKAYHTSKTERSGNDFQIANRRSLEEFCLGLLSGEREEHFLAICVNAQCKVVGVAEISEGSLGEVAAYPRKVAEAVLRTNAHSVFFAHNHPGGTCAPSGEDIASTLQLQRMLNALDVLVLDHVIVAGTSTYSLAAHGEIEFGARRR